MSFFSRGLLANIETHTTCSFKSILSILLIGILALVVVHLAFTLIRRRPAGSKATWNIWKMLIGAGTLTSIVILAITSFYSVLAYGEIGGWALFFHMCGAGMFTGMLPLLAITMAYSHSRCHCCTSQCCARKKEEGEATTKRGIIKQTLSTITACLQCRWIEPLAFWGILVGGLVVTLTMLISMLPIFGSDGLHELLEIHRYSGVFVVAAATFYLYASLLRWIGWR